MVTVRGVNLYPSSVDEVILRNIPHAQYQVHVRSSSALSEVRIILESALDTEGAKEIRELLESELRNAFFLRFEIETVPAGSLPRSEHKSRRWIRDNSVAREIR